MKKLVRVKENRDFGPGKRGGECRSSEVQGLEGMSQAILRTQRTLS